MSGFGGEARADNHIQVSGCAGTEGTNYFAEDYLVYCSSAATGSDIGIDLTDATISLPTNYVGYSGVWGYHTGTGNINIKIEGGSVTTPALQDAHGVYGYHAGTGDIDIKILQVHAITTEGNGAHGVYGLHFGTSNIGNIGINVQDSAITTSGTAAYGILGRHNGTGDISIKAEGGSVTTSGAAARAVYGWHEGVGNIDILVKDSTLTTSGVTPLGDGSRAVFGLHRGTRGNLGIGVQDSTIMASGFGIQADSLSGTGNVNIEVKGSAVTSSGDAIYGLLRGDDGNIDIKVLGDSTITASGRGIRVDNRGTGDINIEVKDSTVKSSGHAIDGNFSGVGDLSIVVQGSTVATSGLGRGINSERVSTGDIRMDVRNSIITATREGIHGLHWGVGNLDIDVQGSTVTASGNNSAVYGSHQGAGHLRINVKDSTLKALGTGSGARGILGWRRGDGSLNIDVRGSTVTTMQAKAHGIHGYHWGTGSHVNIDLQGGSVHASGPDAHGIKAGELFGSVSYAWRDGEGYSRQTVTVNGAVRGGSGDAAGVYLAGGGRVVVGPNGRVGAASGIAIRAVGRGSDGLPSPLSVDFRLDGNPMQEALGSGRIVNNDGSTELRINGVRLYDSAEGVTDRWTANGAWDVRTRAAEAGGIKVTEAYAPRAELYESLPGLLLRLDAGAPVRRPEEPAWARFAYGVGSGDPKRSQTGANYDFDRAEAMVGLSRSWANGFGGSLWLRHVQSEVKADTVSGAGELELHGAGAGMSAHWRGAGGLEISGEVSLTDFDVDADSKRHGRLARDVGAELWQARLAVAYRMEQAEGLVLSPRAWAWHAEADVDPFTDTVGSRVAYADESRSAAGLGVLAEVTQPEYSLYGSLDVESMFAGEETVAQVSGQGLGSESKRTQVLVGMGGRWQGERVVLQGGLRLADPGRKNQEASASVSISGSF